jgi:transposase
MDWKKSESGVIRMKKSNDKVLQKIEHIEKTILQLHKDNQKLHEENTELKKQILTISKENNKLKQRLIAYENAHTPSSKQRFKKQPPEKPSGKLGAKTGHEKWKREMPEPTQTIEHTQTCCPKCNHELGQPTKIIRKIIEDIPEPQPAIVTEHLISQYYCKHCGKIIVPKVKLPRGSFGYNLQTEIALLNVDSRLPLRKIKSILQRNYKLAITDAHIYKMLYNTSNKLSFEYEKNIQLIRASPFVHADETGMRVNGKNYYLWVFTNGITTIFTITKTRSKKTINQILGENYSGIIICDGWTAYSTYTNKTQRCWAHILREAKYLAKDFPLFKTFYERLCKMFSKTKKLLEQPIEKRKPEYENLFNELTKMLDCMESHSDYKKLATKIRNGGKNWFTCLLHSNIEPTNNLAEQTIREPIIRRKIFGCLRNQKGANTFSILTSLITTWKQQELNPFTQIKQNLENG